MKYILNLAIAIFLVTGCTQAQTSKKDANSKTYPVKKTESEWKKILTPIAFQIMVKGGTEAPFKNAFHDNHEKGIYVSAATGEPLFSSDDKYDSGTGWPSFTKPINSKAVAELTDNSFGTVRTEIVESKTGLHLGHVFDDGPENRGGKRYCMNSGALKFVKK